MNPDRTSAPNFHSDNLSDLFSDVLNTSTTLRRSARLANRPSVTPAPRTTNTPTIHTPAPSVRPTMEALNTLFSGMQEQLTSANCRVPKLNERNYVRWRRDMELYLKDANLWETVTTAPPADPPLNGPARILGLLLPFISAVNNHNKILLRTWIPLNWLGTS